VTLVVLVPGQPKPAEKENKVIGLVLPGSVRFSKILDAAEDLKGKVVRYPSFGFPGMEYGKVTLDARRFRMVSLQEDDSEEKLHKKFGEDFSGMTDPRFGSAWRPGPGWDRKTTSGSFPPGGGYSPKARYIRSSWPRPRGRREEMSRTPEVRKVPCRGCR